MRRREVTRGFTLLEVLVALLILGVALAALMSALLANTGLNSRVSRAAEAIRLSEDVLEGYRQAGNYGDLRQDKQETVQRNNVSYTVVTDFCPTDAPSSMACSDSAAYIRLEVKDGNTILHRVETYYTSFGKE